MNIVFNENNIKQHFEDGVKKGSIIAYYQPKYDAVNGKITGAEALARWIDEDGSLIPPFKFIPIMEQSDLITQLDWHIFEVVCKFLHSQIEKGAHNVPISVNFSRIHTYENGFVDKLCDVIDSYNVPHNLIEVEITESALVNGKNIIDFIVDIRAAGFAVAIDDFGSGLSSLNFVKDVPANVLKIDKSLLSANCESEKERIVLESIFTFAKRLKLSTVAEGVETKEQLGFLRTCGCDTIQGYYFAKPMSEDDYVHLLTQDAVNVETEDILSTQAPTTATQLLLDAVFMCYPLVIMSNLSRNSYYMMVYDNFTTRACASTGVYTELIVHGATTMHPDDQQLFEDTFNINDQIDAYNNKGQRTRRVITRQLGDDGIYRRVETTNYYVKNPASDDILAITLSRTLEYD